MTVALQVKTRTALVAVILSSKNYRTIVHVSTVFWSVCSLRIDQAVSIVPEIDVRTSAGKFSNR